MRQENLPQSWTRTFSGNQSAHWNIWDFIQRHWLKIALLGFLLYLMNEKNISFQVKMGGAGLSAITPFEVSASPVSFVDLGDESSSAMTLAEYVEEISPEEAGPGGISAGEEAQLLPESPSPLPAGGKPETPDRSRLSPAIQNMGNLTLILSPDFISRHEVPRYIVEEKMAHIQNYIGRFAPVAVSEMKKYGIPASIKLAQGLLESNVGDSRLAQKNNNHFGIKCFSKSCARGHCSNFTDDSHKDFFRNYDSAWESYRAHSLFLQGQRYIHLRKLGKRDYKGWAHGLKKAGYATDKRYAQKIIKIIETLNLDQYDAR